MHTPPDARPTIDVVAAVLRDAQGRVLITERPAGRPLAGYWEFPGGKIEPGERPFAALHRELEEELGVRVNSAYPLTWISHDYPERRVRLEVWRVVDHEGTPVAREGQRLAWVSAEALADWKLLPADGPIVQSLRLPPYLLVTPDPNRCPDGFLEVLERSLRRGVDWVQFRAPGLEPADFERLAAEVIVRCRHHGCRVSLNAEPDLVSTHAMPDGIHLTSARLRALEQRPSVPGLCVGVSCHDAEDVRRAVRAGLDYLILGPVLETESHPGRPCLGWDRFGELTSLSDVPVYAIGGMMPEHLPEVRRRGGHGIAAIRGLWGGIQSSEVS